MMKRIAVIGLVVAACGLVGAGDPAGVGTVAAEEVRQQLNAPMILNLLARPLESPEAAFNKELKSYAGVSASAKGDEVLRRTDRHVERVVDTTEPKSLRRLRIQRDSIRRLVTRHETRHESVRLGRARAEAAHEDGPRPVGAPR